MKWYENLNFELYSKIELKWNQNKWCGIPIIFYFWTILKFFFVEFRQYNSIMNVMKSNKKNFIKSNVQNYVNIFKLKLNEI